MAFFYLVPANRYICTHMQVKKVNKPCSNFQDFWKFGASQEQPSCHAATLSSPYLLPLGKHPYLLLCSCYQRYSQILWFPQIDWVSLGSEHGQCYKYMYWQERENKQLGGCFKQDLYLKLDCTKMWSNAFQRRPHTFTIHVNVQNFTCKSLLLLVTKCVYCYILYK